jgi:hypothetical protein
VATRLEKVKERANAANQPKLFGQRRTLSRPAEMGSSIFNCAAMLHGGCEVLDVHLGPGLAVVDLEFLCHELPYKKPTKRPNGRAGTRSKRPHPLLARSSSELRAGAMRQKRFGRPGSKEMA